jgi:ketosteroid isomerase-like protein
MRPWESFEIEIEDLVDGGDGQVLFLARATARIRDSGTEITQETGALHRVEAGKIASIHYYLDQAQARQAAGLS